MTNYEHQKQLRQAAIELGHTEPISIEPDGIIWLGIDPDRVYLTQIQQVAVEAQAKQNAQAITDARASALAKLETLGLTAAEIAALLGA